MVRIRKQKSVSMMLALECSLHNLTPYLTEVDMALDFTVRIHVGSKVEILSNNVGMWG